MAGEQFAHAFHMIDDEVEVEEVTGAAAMAPPVEEQSRARLPKSWFTNDRVARVQGAHE